MKGNAKAMMIAFSGPSFSLSLLRINTGITILRTMLSKRFSCFGAGAWGDVGDIAAESGARGLYSNKLE